ncbi:MAG: amidase family protein, partial [Candidatus Latescibacterota bacterium]
MDRSIALQLERIAALDLEIEALVGEENHLRRLQGEVDALEGRVSRAKATLALRGCLVGIKDIFHVDGLPTRAGSLLPPEALAGEEAACVRLLKEAGALVLGKTTTTEFAFFEPGPTRNPNNTAHTPGGSSSGSAAAVAAGYCPLAIGSQTVGSVIRPAAFCGVLGFKPSWGRIPSEGMLYY